MSLSGAAVLREKADARRAGRAEMSREMRELISIHLEEVAKERLACAEIARAQRCICQALKDSKPKWIKGDGCDWRPGDPHFAVCPAAIAQAILDRGRRG